MTRTSSRLLCFSAALATLLAVSSGACTDPAPAEPPCTGPACGAGTGGSGGGSDVCPDHAAESGCQYDGAGDSCVDGICTHTTGRCGGGERCCTLALSCQDEVGQRAGGTRCEDDTECRSGHCVEVAGVRSCLRVCAYFSEGDSCPAGQHCETLSLPGGATTTTCVGGTAEERQPEQTTCTRPSHCPEERPCRIFNGERMDDGTGVALCLPPAATDDWLESCPPPAGAAVPKHGQEQSGQCEAGGLCWDGCRGYSSYACYCTEAQLLAGTCRGFFCTGLCSVDGDCPDRTICQSFSRATTESQDPSLTVAICRFPSGEPLDWGCWDELDCCSNGRRANGGVCCSEGEAEGSGLCASPPTPAEATHCRLVPREGRYLTLCDEAIGLAVIGAPCTTGAECASNLCLDDGAGARSCSSPCAMEYDRCPDVAAGTTCCPTLVEAEGQSYCVPACRASCESPPACEP